MQLAAVAPAAPAIPYALLALSSAIAFVVSWGLLHGWGASFGRLFQWLGNKAISIPLPHLPDVSIHPFGFLLDLDQQVRAALGQAVGATEHAMVTSFQRMVGIIQWSAQELRGLAVDTYNAVRNVEHTTVTHVTKVVQHTVVKPITKTVTITKGVGTAVARRLTHRVDVLAHRVNVLAHTVAGTLTHPIPRLGRLEKTVRGQAGRITRLEKAAFGVVAAGFGVAVLAKSLIGWLRCPSVGKAMRKRNCIDFDLLDALLTGTLLIVGTISLVEFAEEVGAVTEEANGLIHGFLRDV